MIVQKKDETALIANFVLKRRNKKGETFNTTDERIIKVYEVASKGQGRHKI